MKKLAVLMSVTLVGLMVFGGILVPNCKAARAIKIGIPLPLTGRHSPFGHHQKRAFDLALEEINAAGGVNGHPIEVSPVAGVLWELGFRFEKPGEMAWPPRRGLRGKRPPSDQQEFLPHYLEPAPVEYGPGWTLGRAPEAVRPVLARALEVFAAQVRREGWQAVWDNREPRAKYRGQGYFAVRIEGSCVALCLRSPFLRAEGRRRRFNKHWRVASPADVSEVLLAEAAASVRTVEELTDRFLAGQGVK